MKHTFKYFACLFVAILCFGQVWATETTVTWTASKDALGSTISEVNGTATGTIATTNGSDISYNWSYTRTLAVLKSGKADYVAMSGSYMQLGSSNAGENVEFRTSNIPGTIKSVTVLAGSKDSRHTGTITVGGTDYNAGDISAWASSAGGNWTGTGTSTGEIVISINCNEKKSPIYIASITVVYEESAEGCTSEVTITKADNPANGTFSLDQTGKVCIDEGNAMVNVTATPAEHYHLATVTSTVGTVGSISNNTCAITNISANTTVSVTFAEDTKYKVTWNVNGNEDTKTDVYSGEKPVFPTTPESCDATSTTFIGWATAAWSGKLADLSDKTVYTSASAMPAVDGAVTYYAVFAKSNGSASSLFSWEGGTKADLAAKDGVSTLTADNSDYAAENAPYRVKWNTEGHYIVISVASQPGQVSVGFKMLGGATTSTVTVQEADATDGTFTDVEEFTISGAKNDIVNGETSSSFKSTTRAIKLIYHKGSNVGLGPISIEGVVSKSDYMTTCAAATVATPTFSVAGGTYTAVQSVEISCVTEGTTIYYTTDGSTPDDSKTEYTGAISVGESMTIRAIAIKGAESSAVATADYTINLPLSTMDQIFAAATAAGSTATDVNITFGNWVVSGVSTNGKNVYVTDGTKGFIIFDNTASMGFAVGNVFSGTAACKVQLYKGAAELTTLSSSTEGLNVATGGSVTPVAKAISALSGINTGAPVTINSLQFDGTNLSDGSNSIKPYNSLFAYGALENGKYYNVTGIYLQFDATKEILPRSAADIVEVDLADPEISYTPATATIELGESLPGTTFANPHELAISYSSNNESVATVSNTGVIALGTATGTAVITASFAGNSTYAAGNVTYTITVNPASVSQNVVILAQYDSKYYAMSTTIANETAVPIEVEYDGTKITVSKDADKDAIQWTKKTSGDNTTFQTKDEDKLYLKGTSGGGTLSLNANVCNWTWNGTNNCYVTGTRGFIYRVSVNGFKNYATSNLSNADYIAPEVIAIAAENIIISSKADPQLAYDPTSVELTIGDDFTPATLTNADGFDGLAAVTYGSTNETLATVATDGTVSLASGKTGTATITATFAGNNNYLAGSASYTITVNAPAPTPTGTTYTKVTDASDITDGEYLIVYETTSVAFNGALETLDAEGNSIAVTINEGVIAGTTAIDAAVFTIDVTAGTLQSASGKYIGVSSNSNGLKQTEDASTYTHTFSIDEGGNAVISANFEGSTMKLRYNPSTSSGNLRFRYYKNDGQQAVQLYKKESATPPTPTADYTRTVTAGRYGTICLPNGGTISGAKLYDLEYFDGSYLYFLEVNDNAMVAGRPYVFLPSATTIEVTYTDNANASAGSVNGLVGSYTQETVDADDGNYILYQNKYYLVNSEAYVGANRAYIHMASVPTEPSTPQQGDAPRRRISMGVQGEQVATGIMDIETGEQPMKVMMDGKLYIIRAGQWYDMTGRKVK